MDKKTPKAPEKDKGQQVMKALMFDLLPLLKEVEALHDTYTTASQGRVDSNTFVGVYPAKGERPALKYCVRNLFLEKIIKGEERRFGYVLKIVEGNPLKAKHPQFYITKGTLEGTKDVYSGTIINGVPTPRSI